MRPLFCPRIILFLKPCLLWPKWRINPLKLKLGYSLDLCLQSWTQVIILPWGEVWSCLQWLPSNKTRIRFDPSKQVPFLRSLATAKTGFSIGSGLASLDLRAQNPLNSIPNIGMLARSEPKLMVELNLKGFKLTTLHSEEIFLSKSLWSISLCLVLFLLFSTLGVLFFMTFAWK